LSVLLVALFSLSVEGVSIALGDSHSCAVLADATVKCWGYNYDSQLGDGTNTTRNSPVEVLGITTAVSIALSDSHSCVLLTDGTVECWGRNSYGKLGDGTSTDRNSPVKVSGLIAGITKATSIALGHYYSCALLADATVKCWGRNDAGQLGDGTNTDQITPVGVLGITTATSIASGAKFSCALLADATVKCWGDNMGGQLGDGTTTDRNSPVGVSGITTATGIASGHSHSCALLADATVKCWGSSYHIKDKTSMTVIPDYTTPVEVSNFTTATSVALGNQHSCVLLTDGKVMCWGGNIDGQLGDGTTTDRTTPVEVSGLILAFPPPPPPPPLSPPPPHASPASRYSVMTALVVTIIIQVQSIFT